ncbi:MAG: EAL domain-containing protein [Planctomycetota bacterium]|nr:MAG: EAL domain-containing protein [Planctomycetota bacterium]
MHRRRRSPEGRAALTGMCSSTVRKRRKEKRTQSMASGSSTRVEKCCRWQLVGTSANAAALVTQITNNPFRIGRSSESHLQLPSRRVSKAHAEIVVLDDAVFVRDLMSTNGTFVNGRRVEFDMPVGEGDILQFGDFEFRLEQVLPSEPAADADIDCSQTLFDSGFEVPSPLAYFKQLISAPDVIPYFQPIVELATLYTRGFEVLARSPYPGLESPGEMFSQARKLQREAELSHVCRQVGVAAAQQLPGLPLLFLNTHPAENLCEFLLPRLKSLRETYPEQPIVVELHEAAVADVPTMKEFRKQLDDLQMALAYDDFGAGQSRLLDLIQVPPDFLKFDVKLVRDIDKAARKQQHMLEQLVRLVREAGVAVLAEGIETAAEAATCRLMGFDYIQGYLIGRPKPLEEVLQAPLRHQAIHESIRRAVRDFDRAPIR